jgi:hypothetical protein
LRTSDDLEIYEIEQASKDKLEEICDLRQPVLLELPNEEGYKIINTTNKQFLLDNYPVFEIKIRNINDISLETDVCVPLQLHIASKLFNEDPTASYFSEGNMDFLQETGAIKNMSYNDEFIRPYLVSNCYYDILFASNKLETPFRYDLNYRNYYMVTHGSIRVKLSPPKSSKYLYPINDFENFEFRSPINPWNPQTKYKADFDKIKCLEIVLTPGKLLFIPAYWWYTFKFEENTSVSCFKYRTYMNNIAISPKICMYALQNQNVERKIAKHIDISELHKKQHYDILTKDNIANDNYTNNDDTNNNDTNYELTNENIPAILIPKEEPEPLPQNDLFADTLIDNDNLEIINENKVISSSI